MTMMIMFFDLLFEDFQWIKIAISSWQIQHSILDFNIANKFSNRSRLQQHSLIKMYVFNTTFISFFCYHSRLKSTMRRPIHSAHFHATVRQLPKPIWKYHWYETHYTFPTLYHHLAFASPYSINLFNHMLFDILANQFTYNIFSNTTIRLRYSTILYNPVIIFEYWYTMET